MVRTKLFFLLLVLVQIFILTSCSFMSNQSSSLDVDQKVYGVKGLFFNVNQINDEVYQNSKVQFLIDLKNNGASESYVVVSTPLFNRKYLSNPEIRGDYEFGQVFRLEGKSVSSAGQEIKLPVILDVNKLSLSEDQHTESINFGVCYSYKTIFEDDFCVDTDIFALKEASSKVCQVKEKSYSKGQGAPIEIVSANVYFEDNGEFVKPVIQIKLKNSGGGMILTDAGFNKLCRGLTVNSRYDKLQNIALLSKLDFSSYNLNDFDCGGTDIKFNQNGDGEILCRLKSDGNGISKTQGTYTSKLHLELEYFYRETELKEIVIQKR